MKSGKISVNVLKRSVFKQIRAKREEVVNGAGMGADCAVFTFADGDMTVSCIQEAPVAVQEDSAFLREAAEIAQEAGGAESSGKSGNNFAERRTMAQLIQKCANNLAAKGAEPVAVLITLLLPENTEEPDIKKLMAEADGACQELHMQIAGGQTRVTTAVKVPCGVVTGIGKISKETHHRLRGAAPGQDVVISKWIGLEGTSLLARQYGELLSERLPVYFVEEAAGFGRLLSVVPEAATAVKSGVCAMHDVSEGGIFGALWELAEGAGVGLTIDLKKLPLRQETVEVCECCNVNPYELLSGGCLLMTCEDGSALVSALRAEGIAAVTVGKVTDSNDRILVNEDEVRYLDRPKVDQIYGG
ncbi:MAG: hydrogenase maturation factor [Lachnospiraceae bacterium]|nr:hydrogenase maturation factor [Lachnospiraceae bacterium]